MACLDTTSKSLTIELTGSPATQAQWTVHYATRSGTDFTESSNDGVTNSTTPVTMIAAPGSGEIISIRDITVYNADVSSVTIVIKLVNGGNSRVLYRQTLGTLESWSSLAQKGKDGAQGLTGSVSAASGLILDEGSAPNTATNQGALYVPSSDNLLRYRGESNGTERRIALIDTTNLATNDLFYYGSDGLFKRIAIGTLDQVLVAKPSSNPPYQWATPVYREVLTANRTYYVRTDGNDSNNGLADTAGGAFLTWDRTHSVISAIDGNGYKVTVKFNDGTRTTPIVINKSLVGISELILEGNTTTPSNCVINVTTGNAFTFASVPITCMLKGFRIVASAIGVNMYSCSLINMESCVFGNCAYHIVNKRSTAQFYAYTISEGADRHFIVDQGIIALGGVITLAGTPAFTTFAWARYQGVIENWGGSFSGSATGKRYESTYGSVIISGGQTFPGNSSGTSATGYYI